MAYAAEGVSNKEVSEENVKKWLEQLRYDKRYDGISLSYIDKIISIVDKQSQQERTISILNYDLSTEKRKTNELKEKLDRKKTSLSDLQEKSDTDKRKIIELEMKFETEKKKVHDLEIRSERATVTTPEKRTGIQIKHVEKMEVHGDERKEKCGNCKILKEKWSKIQIEKENENRQLQNEINDLKLEMERNQIQCSIPFEESAN